MKQEIKPREDFYPDLVEIFYSASKGTNMLAISGGRVGLDDFFEHARTNLSGKIWSVQNWDTYYIVNKNVRVYFEDIPSKDEAGAFVICHYSVGFGSLRAIWSYDEYGGSDEMVFYKDSFFKKNFGWLKDFFFTKKDINKGY